MVLDWTITAVTLAISFQIHSALGIPTSKSASCPDSLQLHDFFAKYRAELPPHLRLARGALVVACEKRLTFGEGFGRTAAGDPVNPNQTIFRAASNSKLIVATAVMQLADGGLWSADDDVNRYLPPASRLAPLRGDGP